MKDLKTGQEWCDFLGIEIVDKLNKGFIDYNFFSTVKISKKDFINRVTQCELNSTVASRKQILKYKNFLIQK